MDSTKELYNKIEILIQHKKVYLVNKLDEIINSLVYNTFSMVSIDNEIGISDAPHYQIQDIPAGHAIYLETLDGWEDGSIYYQVISVKTASIALQDAFTLKQKVRSGLIKLPPIANCSIEKLHSTSGFIVHTNVPETVNELYWLAEELKSYTDLTGSRFDIDNAQKRLFPMRPIMEKIDSHQIQELYNEITELLENSMPFDKIIFSKKIDAFYEILAKMNNKN